MAGETAEVDGNGHGTHCAGTVGGRRFGVAKRANLVAVKVLSAAGSGSISSVIAGIDYVVTQHKQKLLVDVNAKSVASISIGGPKSFALENAVENAVRNGVHIVVAAGNENANACNVSPSGAPSAITVGATTITDTRASFSNFGRCLDIFAPGVNIPSAWIGSTTAERTISGTSMATPHVAGAAALYLSYYNMSPATLRNTMVSTATAGVLVKSSLGSQSPNTLLSIVSLIQ